MAAHCLLRSSNITDDTLDDKSDFSDCLDISEGEEEDFMDLPVGDFDNENEKSGDQSNVGGSPSRHVHLRPLLPESGGLLDIFLLPEMVGME